MRYLKTYESMSYDYVLVVDIQPGHEEWIDFDIEEFCGWLNALDESIIYLFNGPEFGYEDENEIKMWLIDHGLDEDLAYSISFYEKNYAFFRDYMDNGVSDEDVVKVGKYLIENDVRDTRQIPDKDKNKFNISRKYFTDGYSMYIPDLYDFLTNFIDKNSRPLLVGGGRDECLKEVELMLQMMDVDYELEDDYVY